MAHNPATSQIGTGYTLSRIWKSKYGLLHVCLFLLVRQGYVASPQEVCSYDFRFCADVIFLLDRSNSIEEKHFNESRDLIVDIIKESMVIGPEPGRVHLAVVTFDRTAKIDLDLIDESAPCMYLEDIISPDGPFYKDVVYCDENNTNERKNIWESGVFNQTDILLNITPRSPKERRIVFIMSDFHKGEIDSTTVDQIKGWIEDRQRTYPNFEAYGILIGQWEKPTGYDKMTRALNTTNDVCTAGNSSEWQYRDFTKAPKIPPRGRLAENSSLCEAYLGETPISSSCPGQYPGCFGGLPLPGLSGDCRSLLLTLIAVPVIVSISVTIGLLNSRRKSRAKRKGTQPGAIGDENSNGSSGNQYNTAPIGGGNVTANGSDVTVDAEGTGGAISASATNLHPDQIYRNAIVVEITNAMKAERAEKEAQDKMNAGEREPTWRKAKFVGEPSQSIPADDDCVFPKDPMPIPNVEFFSIRHQRLRHVNTLDRPKNLTSPQDTQMKQTNHHEQYNQTPGSQSHQQSSISPRKKRDSLPQATGISSPGYVADMVQSQDVHHHPYESISPYYVTMAKNVKHEIERRNRINQQKSTKTRLLWNNYTERNWKNPLLI